MDNPRYFRIVLPPFVLIGMVLLADYMNGTLGCRLDAWSGEKLAAIGGIIAASIIPAGFGMGTASSFSLEAVDYLTRRFRWKSEHIGHGRFNLLVPDSVSQLLLRTHGIMGNEASADLKLALMRDFVFHRNEKWLAEHINRLWDASVAHWGSLLALIPAAIIAGDMSIISRWWLVVLLLLAALFFW